MAATILGGLGCALVLAGLRDSSPPPIIVIGLDGAAPHVVEDLWRQGELPHLRALADRGVFGPLRTNSQWSPVIWTTLATGVDEATHGISFFTVPTRDGEVPVTSNLRRVKAIWNLASESDRSVAVLGWWVTWPAEPVNGIVATDRMMTRLEGRVYPENVGAMVDEIREAGDTFGFQDLPAPPGENWEQIPQQDRLVANLTRRLVDRDFDLMMSYLRSIDLVSHRYWKYYHPARFGRLPGWELERFGALVTDAYEAVDRAIGAIVEAAPEDAHIFVISDHGFADRVPEVTQVRLDLDRVLEAVGLLIPGAGGPDLPRSRLVTHRTPVRTETKLVRVVGTAGPATPAEIRAVRAETEEKLFGVRYRNGRHVFQVRDARAEERADGADFVVRVLTRSATNDIYWEGREIEGAVESTFRFSGQHSAHTPGIFLAAGPGIDADADLSRIDVRDVAPTVVFALGLEVPEAMEGRVLEHLFTEEFRDRVDLRYSRDADFARRPGEEALATDEDERLLEELRALGYLD
ncbi:MAG: alkaline phosphatase family protein [Thermoanaerobaculia bacterium]|nr:alkaline phosphatase family protein [Thermoanaerobaculia bacterium]